MNTENVPRAIIFMGIQARTDFVVSLVRDRKD